MSLRSDAIPDFHGPAKDGKPTHNEWTGKFDSKDYPVVGDPTSDARSYTKIDDRTLGLNAKNNGKTTRSGRITVAPDGKTRTVTTSGTDAMGKKNQQHSRIRQAVVLIFKS